MGTGILRALPANVPHELAENIILDLRRVGPLEVLSWKTGRREEDTRNFAAASPLLHYPLLKILVA
jgi:hypothetical protein